MAPPSGYHRSLSNASLGSAHAANAALAATSNVDPLAPAAAAGHSGPLVAPAQAERSVGGSGGGGNGGGNGGGGDHHVHFASFAPAASTSQRVVTGPPSADGVAGGMVSQLHLVAGGSPARTPTPENVFSGEEDAQGEPVA